MNNKRKIKSAEIDLLTVLTNVWKKKFFIILLTILVAAGMGLRAKYRIPETYTASVTMYANNSKVSEGSDSISASDLSTSMKLVKACGAIINSAPVLEAAGREIGTGGWVPGTVTVYSVDETQVFKVQVTANSGQMAADIANAIAKVAPEKIESIIDGCSVKLISGATVPTEKSGPNIRSHTIKGALLGLALSLFLVCVITLLDTRIKGEDDLSRWEYPILGVIPSFTASQKGGAYASVSKGGNK